MFNIAAWTTHLKCSHTDLVVLWDFWYWELGLFLVIQGDSYLLDIRYLQRSMVVYILDSYINLSSSILDPFIYTSIYRRGFRLPQCSHLRTLKNLLKVHFGKRCEKSGNHWIKSGNRKISRRFIFLLYPRYIRDIDMKHTIVISFEMYLANLELYQGILDISFLEFLV